MECDRDYYENALTFMSKNDNNQEFVQIEGDSCTVQHMIDIGVCVYDSQSTLAFTK